MNKFSQKRKELHHKAKRLLGNKKPDNWFTRQFSRAAQRFGLPFGVLVAIIIALILTSISMTLYFVSGTSKLDLSRPGYESARDQIRRSNSSDQNFSSNGDIDSSVIKDFLKKYDNESGDLKQYSSFSEDILSDEQLGLTAEQAAPSDGANP